MSTARRRVVITGIGAVNPLGLTADAYWEGLAQGRSGVRPVQAFDTSQLTCRFAGEVQGFDAKSYLEKKERKNLRVMARAIQLAVAAAQLALDHGRVDKSRLDPTRFGVEFGAGLIPSELEELAPAAQVSANCLPGKVDLPAWGEKGLPVIPPLWMLKYLPNMLGCHISILHNAQGPNNSITEGDASGLLALGESWHILRRNQADLFLVGGGDSKLNPISMVRQCLFGRLSRRNDAPERASRPFDRNRDGIVIGEGAGVLVVEDLEHAQGRQGTIYGEVVGFGAAFDRKKTGKGLGRAIQQALASAGIAPQDLDHVNAHGLSSPEDDVWEARGLEEGLGGAARTIPVLAVKSYFGHLGAGSGPSELAASLLAFHHGLVPATLNFEEPDPACPLCILRQPKPVTKPYALKTGFTDLGQCAAVVIRKWP